MHPLRSRSAFTLIELLVVIAIIAILAVVVVLTLNPAQLLAQSRDANRVSDASTLNSLLGLYAEDVGGSMGTSSVVYTSLPDPIASSTTLGDQCQGVSLPYLPSGNYHCAASTTVRNTNGTGWIPLKFTSASFGSPVGNLPIDPVNSASKGLYYTYMTDGKRFELTMALESQKYLPLEGNDGGKYADLYEQGTNLALAPIDFYSGGNIPGNALAYWPVNEGSGSTVLDESGNGDNGTWNGTAAGTSGYYSTGRNGAWAGYFNGSNDYVVSSPQTLSDFSVCAWFNSTKTGSGLGHWQLMEVVSSEVPGVANDWGFGVDSNGDLAFGDGGSSDITFSSSNAVNTGSWVFGCGTRVKQTGVISIFVNGTQTGGGTGNAGNILTGNTRVLFGESDDLPNIPFLGLMNDVHLYGRALSLADIQAIYNAEK